MLQIAEETRVGKSIPSAFIAAAHLGICHARWKLSPCVFGCCDIGEERTKDEGRESSVYQVPAWPGRVLNTLKCVLSQGLINQEETYIRKPETTAPNSVFLPTIKSCLISEPQLLFFFMILVCFFHAEKK